MQIGSKGDGAAGERPGGMGVGGGECLREMWERSGFEGGKHC